MYGKTAKAVKLKQVFFVKYIYFYIIKTLKLNSIPIVSQRKIIKSKIHLYLQIYNHLFNSFSTQKNEYFRL